MKQAQSETTVYPRTSSSWVGEPGSARNHTRADGPGVHQSPHVRYGSVSQALLAVVTTLWFMATLPFRLIFWGIAWLGRLTAAVLGFVLMVVGMALWAGPLFFLGIPLFIVGLVVTLRCLD
jgi:hypothetical protein